MNNLEHVTDPINKNNVLNSAYLRDVMFHLLNNPFRDDVEYIDLETVANPSILRDIYTIIGITSTGLTSFLDISNVNPVEYRNHQFYTRFELVKEVTDINIKMGGGMCGGEVLSTGVVKGRDAVLRYNNIIKPNSIRQTNIHLLDNVVSHDFKNGNKNNLLDELSFSILLVVAVDDMDVLVDRDGVYSKDRETYARVIECVRFFGLGIKYTTDNHKTSEVDIARYLFRMAYSEESLLRGRKLEERSASVYKSIVSCFPEHKHLIISEFPKWLSEVRSKLDIGDFDGIGCTTNLPRYLSNPFIAWYIGVRSPISLQLSIIESFKLPKK